MKRGATGHSLKFTLDVLNIWRKEKDLNSFYGSFLSNITVFKEAIVFFNFYKRDFLKKSFRNPDLDYK